jgi:SNF2 family DNA or RNA helicase
LDTIRSLKRYQVDAINAALPVLKRVGGFYIQHDPGMGKTLTALCIARLLQVERIAIICQPAGVGVWRRACERWLPHLPIHNVRGPTERKGCLDPGVHIVNYEQLLKATKDESRLAGEDRRCHLRRSKPQLVIVDEAQSIKGPTSQARSIVRLVARSIGAYKLLLSGTPAHDARDWWSPYNWIDENWLPRPAEVPEEEWNHNFSTYRDWVCFKGGPEGNWVYGVRQDRADIAKEAITKYTHVAEAKDWPELVWSRIPVELDERERKAYDEMLATGSTIVHGREIESELQLTRILRLQQISGGYVSNVSLPIYGRQVGNASKIEATRDLLWERSEKKVVIAAAFTPEVKALDRLCGQLRRPSAIIDGSVEVGPKRDTIVDWFQDPRPELQNAVLIIQYRAGGTSITLTAADALILYSLLPSVIAYRQILGRVWRLGQTKRVEILPLLAENTRDEALLDGLQEGLNNVDLYRFVLGQKATLYGGAYRS